MSVLISKAEGHVIRKSFSTPSELRSAVYASLVNYLEEMELIRLGPFDAATCFGAKIDDIDFPKVKKFLNRAIEKREFPLPYETNETDLLKHLDLIREEKVSNAAVLLFGKKPQRFLISSEVKCAQFFGYEVEKPIENYQIYTGDLFEMVDLAVAFVMSRIDLWVGTRAESTSVPTKYEIPREVVKEAIVNAVAHRNYTSNSSVQVMLFRDRLEVWNSGSLPEELTPAMLKGPHKSIPGNPLIATPMYLAGYIEKVGTGTRDIYRFCKEAGLKEPEFHFDGDFRITIWRKDKNEGLNEGLNGGLNGGLNETLKSLYEFIKKNPGIKTKDISIELKRPVSTVEKQIVKLTEDKLIERRGSRKTGGYWIIDNGVNK